FGGTSSATPLAAGIGALLLSINANLTGEQVRQILRSSCDKIDPVNAQYVNGFSITHGHGRLNARRALEITKEGIQ
ncbi:MAG: S8 family serine peptidase, partial [Nitrososphaeraceae archaeon]